MNFKSVLLPMRVAVLFGGTSEERDVIAAHVPWTRIVTEERSEDIRRRREQHTVLARRPGEHRLLLHRVRRVGKLLEIHFGKLVALAVGPIAVHRSTVDPRIRVLVPGDRVNILVSLVNTPAEGEAASASNELELTADPPHRTEVRAYAERFGWDPACRELLELFHRVAAASRALRTISASNRIHTRRPARESSAEESSAEESGVAAAMAASTRASSSGRMTARSSPMASPTSYAAGAQVTPSCRPP